MSLLTNLLSNISSFLVLHLNFLFSVINYVRNTFNVKLGTDHAYRIRKYKSITSRNSFRKLEENVFFANYFCFYVNVTDPHISVKWNWRFLKVIAYWCKQSAHYLGHLTCCEFEQVSNDCVVSTLVSQY